MPPLRAQTSSTEPRARWHRTRLNRQRESWSSQLATELVQPVWGDSEPEQWKKVRTFQ